LFAKNNRYSIEYSYSKVGPPLDGGVSPPPPYIHATLLEKEVEVESRGEGRSKKREK
jgi:hypothetical protein